MTVPFTDHHVHLMSTAAAGLSIDVSAARRLDDVVAMVAAAVGAGPPPGNGWWRAWGYEEWALRERRHPTRDDLDRAVDGQPLVVHHRSGHAAVLNSAALAELGCADHPDGLLVDHHRLLAAVPRLDRRRLEDAARYVSSRWSAAGVGAAVDATHTNGPAELELYADWCRRGVVTQAVTAMVAPAAVGSVPPFGARVGAVRVGHVKLMPGADLAAAVAAAHSGGYPVAVHVVDIAALDATLGAMEGSPPPEGTTDRIEHNAMCLPEQVGRIAALGPMVVVNPSFLIHRRDKYRSEIHAVERSWLIRMASLVEAGVELRAGSDSPVTPARPAEVLAAATGHPFSPSESLTALQAARLLAP